MDQALICLAVHNDITRKQVHLRACDDDRICDALEIFVKNDSKAVNLFQEGVTYTISIDKAVDVSKGELVGDEDALKAAADKVNQGISQEFQKFVDNLPEQPKDNEGAEGKEFQKAFSEHTSIEEDLPSKEAKAAPVKEDEHAIKASPKTKK